MRVLLTILMLGTFSINGYSENIELIAESQKIILEVFRFIEFNPIHKPESDSIQQKFREVLLQRYKHNITADYTTETETLFRWIYSNSSCEYEDSPDYRRMKMRRAFCFTSVALLSPHDKAYTFLEYAKLSIGESLENPDIELLEQPYLGILLVELMFNIEENRLATNDIVRIENFIEQNKGNIKESVISETLQLMSKCREHTGL